MPTAIRSGPYRLHFYAGDVGEPRHIHVSRAGADAKFWLDPDVQLDRNRRFSAAELCRVRKIVEDHVQALRDSWDAFFNP